MTAENIIKAEALSRLGIATFPVYVKPDPDNPYKTSKKPGIKDGVLGATLDPGYVHDLFEKHPNAHVGVNMGMSGLVAADIDVKHSPDGIVEVDGWDNFEKAWLDLPGTFDFDSVTGVGGKQFIYAAPEGKNLGPAGNYRGILGLDRRGGNSYSVWNGPVPESRDVFTPAPDWLCDESSVKSAAQFEGTVKDWYETLEPGDPSIIVRAAMDRARKQFEDSGNDWDHAAVVERTYEAVRLGAERHPGVPELLALIEELFYSRTGSHSRPEEEWEHEFQESLASGIAKYGETIDLYKSLPPFDISKIPNTIPDRLLVGEPGGKNEFRDLLRSLQENTDDDLFVTSVLWNCPRTKDISREWGLEFVHGRVLSAREKPEPVRENPALPQTTAMPVVTTPRNDQNSSHSFLTSEEQEIVSNTRTFIDEYLEATNTKGFTNSIYAVPAAWTCLSMAFGQRAFIPLSKPLEVNLWFIVLGESTTGKGTEDRFLRGVLNSMFLDGESENYNLGALSSPDGLHLGLINRDGLPSIIHNDEASDFFRDIKVKDWMAAVPDKLSKWFDGFVEPSSKISLKDARGKSAHTSLNQLMWGTPERLLTLLDATQFDSGYLARVNWVWDKRVPDPNKKSDLKIQPGRKSETPDSVYRLAMDLLHAGQFFGDRFPVSGTPEAQDRLNQAADSFRQLARGSSRWSFIKPAVDRLVMETLWKCSALLALYRGSQTFGLTDALVAIHYASDWLETLMSVSESISESPYSRDVEEMESFIRGQGGECTRALLLHSFRGKIVRTQRELDDRIGFLIESGRILRQGKDGAVVYKLNE